MTLKDCVLASLVGTVNSYVLSTRGVQACMDAKSVDYSPISKFFLDPCDDILKHMASGHSLLGKPSIV